LIFRTSQQFTALFFCILLGSTVSGSSFVAWCRQRKAPNPLANLWSPFWIILLTLEREREKKEWTENCTITCQIISTLRGWWVYISKGLSCHLFCVHIPADTKTTPEKGCAPFRIFGMSCRLRAQPALPVFKLTQKPHFFVSEVFA
jgi:hypothetical protein